MSKAWRFNMEDAKKVAKNALIFLAPIIIIELELLRRGETSLDAYLNVLQVWILGVALDFFRKLSSGKK
jgi:hypothetical protein